MASLSGPSQAGALSKSACEYSDQPFTPSESFAPILRQAFRSIESAGQLAADGAGGVGVVAEVDRQEIASRNEETGAKARSAASRDSTTSPVPRICGGSFSLNEPSATAAISGAAGAGPNRFSLGGIAATGECLCPRRPARRR